MKRILICFWLFLIFILTFSTQAVNRYVAKTGNDTTGDGSVGNPYLTVQKGVNVAQAGDTIFLAAGTYPETVFMARSGTAGNPITIDGQGVATVNVNYGTN